MFSERQPSELVVEIEQLDDVGGDFRDAVARRDGLAFLHHEQLPFAGDERGAQRDRRRPRPRRCRRASAAAARTAARGAFDERRLRRRRRGAAARPRGGRNVNRLRPGWRGVAPAAAARAAARFRRRARRRAARSPAALRRSARAGSRCVDVAAPASHAARHRADDDDRRSCASGSFVARADRSTARFRGCAIIRRAPCIDWFESRFGSSAHHRRHHPRPIRFDAAPRQSARRPRRPSDDRARVPPRVGASRIVSRSHRRHRRSADRDARPRFRRQGAADQGRRTRPAPTGSPKSPRRSTATSSSTCRATSR